MKKRKRFTKAGALLLALAMMFSTFLTIAPQVLAADPNVTIDDTKKGSLTIYKLDANGLSQAEYDDFISNGGSASDYYKNEPADGSAATYHKYLQGAEYTVYLIGTVKQTTDSSGNVTVEYIDAVDNSTVINLNDLDNYVSGIDLDDYSDETGTTDSDGKVAFTGKELGLYYVKETKTPTGYAVANNFFVQLPMTNADGTAWEYDVTAYPKNNDNGDIEKEITSGTTPDNGKETASLGSTIGYSITATTPSNLITSKDDGAGGTTTEINYKDFWITDKASKYLTVNTSGMTVAAKDSDGNDITLTSSDYTIEQVLYNDPSGDGDYNYTYVKFTDAGLSKLGNSAVVTVTYSAAIAAEIDAALTIEINNEAYFQYKVDGNSDITKGPGDEVKVYTYSYSAQKIDKDAAALDGAKFVLAQYLDASGKPAASGTLNYLTYSGGSTGSGWGYSTDIADAYVVTSSTGAASDDYEKGLFAFRGLAAGNYLLVETEAPSGYTLLKDPVNITINSTTTDTANETSTTTNQYNKYTIQIINNQNGTIKLPTTGGSGIYMFIIIGAALMAIAAVIYVKSRKSNKTA